MRISYLPDQLNDANFAQLTPNDPSIEKFLLIVGLKQFLHEVDLNHIKINFAALTADFSPSCFHNDSQIQSLH